MIEALLPLLRRIITTGFVLLAATLCQAEPVQVAVATNFKSTLEQLAGDFTRQTGQQLIITSASSGVLATQIRHGAPFDIFLSADSQQPERLEQQQLTVPGSRFTFALGRLALFYRGSTEGDTTNDSIEAVLKRFEDKRVAIANPELAPYGLAARQVLIRLGLWEQKQQAIVRGSNVAQAIQYFMTGNTDLAFGAYSQFLQYQSTPTSVHNPIHIKLVPAEWHDPIAQQAILLKTAQNKPAAQKFYQFLQTHETREQIRKAGYGMVDIHSGSTEAKESVESTSP